MSEQTNMRLEVLRPFWMAGEVCQVGAIVEVAPVLAAELTGANKARLAPCEQEPATVAEPKRRAKGSAK
jgi:hypothetical protein